MKAFFPILSFLILALLSCGDDDRLLFDKSSEERSREAIENLKNELVAPQNGWLLIYRPESDAGRYNVLLNFTDDNKVNIKTDLAANNGEYFDQTIPFRIDNSMGLELIFETYSFFSYLFEQDLANFGAEFEYIYVNKTPDNSLVFVSKSDNGIPTRITLRPASANDVNLLGHEVSSNFSRFGSSLKMSFIDKDIAFNMSRDNLRRSLTFTYVSPKTNVNAGEELDFTTGYLIQADSIILDTPFTGVFNGQEYVIKSIKLGDISESQLNICPEPANVPVYSGTILNSNEKVRLETSLFDIYGANFNKQSSIFLAPIYYIFDQDDRSVGSQIQDEIDGAEYMVLLYEARTRFEPGDLTAIGFWINNGEVNEPTFAMKKFVPTLDQNNLKFGFANEYTLYDYQSESVNFNGIDFYLDKLSEGGRTYIYRVNNFFFEFYNPCSGWRFYFQIL